MVVSVLCFVLFCFVPLFVFFYGNIRVLNVLYDCAYKQFSYFGVLPMCALARCIFVMLAAHVCVCVCVCGWWGMGVGVSGWMCVCVPERERTHICVCICVGGRGGGGLLKFCIFFFFRHGVRPDRSIFSVTRSYTFTVV